MIHANSRAALREEKENGNVSKRASLIMELLQSEPEPLTDRQVMAKLGFTEPNAVRPRITELVDMGLLTEHDQVPCPITKKRVRRVSLTN